MTAAVAAAAAAAAQPPVSAQVVGNAFVQQYYHILHHSPGLVFRFYQDISKLGRPEDDGSMSITSTMQAINDKILSLNYADFRAEIKSVDSQESFNGGVHVLVTGYLTGKDNLIRNFSQTFFLAPQDRGYFVLNDMFRYVEIAKQQDAVQVPETDVLAPVTPEQIVADPPPAQENHISEQSTPSAEEANGGEVYNPPEDDSVPVVVEEVPVAKVVDEVQGDSKMVAETNIIIEEVPKKSYASIVMHLKESAATFSPPPAPAPRKIVPKNVEQVRQPLAPAPADSPVLSLDFVDNVNNQEGEADGHSIYIKGLPMSATAAMLEDEFKKFGPIKNGGIQVRSNRQQGFCFGFVEFEVETAVQKAIEASPILIGGRQAAVEEKKSTSSRAILLNKSIFRQRKKMSQNSYSSQRKCSCGLVVKTLISSTTSNPGRRFFRCPRPDFSSCGYWEWEDQVFPEVAYLRNLESSLKDVKMEMDNSKIEVENLKIEMENLKIVVENLKIKVGHLSKTIATLEASNDLVVEKVRIFQDKYHKIKYKVMISCFLFVGFLVALTTK